MKSITYIAITLFTLTSCKSQIEDCVSKSKITYNNATSFEIDLNDFNLVFTDLNNGTENPSNDYKISDEQGVITIMKSFLETDDLFNKNFLIQSESVESLNVEAITKNDYVFNGDEKVAKLLGLSTIDTLTLNCQEGLFNISPTRISSYSKKVVQQTAVNIFTAYQNAVLESTRYSTAAKENAKRVLNSTDLDTKPLQDLMVNYENVYFDLIFTYNVNGEEKEKYVRIYSIVENSKTEAKPEINGVYIKGEQLIINTQGEKKAYDGLVVNGMSVNTTLINEGNDSFYLIYEYTGSSTKRQIAYKFSVNTDTFLIYKEEISFGREGTKSTRIYFDNLKLARQSVQDLESLGDSIKTPFEANDAPAETFVFNSNGEKIANILYKITAEDRFLEFPILEKNDHFIAEFKITNSEKIRHIALSYEKFGLDNEYRLLMDKLK